MKPKYIITLIVVFVVLIIGTVIGTSAIGVCDAQEKIVVQPLWGPVRVQEDPGPYFKGFAKTWSYPRNIEFRYNDDPRDGDEDDGRIKVTFNDGGEADLSTYIRLQLPISEADLLAFHQEFGGSSDNIKASIKSWMIDCMKSTAPLMSASENQSARKSEFRQMVLEQMTKGLYDMNLEEVIKKDTTDTTGEEITVYKTTIRLVDGRPVITTKSPITEKFHMTITQFSVTGTAYDTETRKQFAAKKESYLGAERAKAERSQEVQERLMIIEKGLREKAEAEAAGNVLMATAVIAAELKANVALQTKIEAETKAEQLLAVADLDKQTLLMAESAIFEQAVIKAETALELKKEMIAKAEGRKEAIELSGDITELEEAMIRAEVDKVVAWADGLAKFQVPQTMIFGGGGAGGEGVDLTNALFQMRLMQGAGLIDQVKIDNSKVTRQVARPARK
jgi:hypothetical protein